MTKTTNQNPFQTYDLGISAALISTGFQLADLDKSNNRKVLFIFNRDEGIDDAVNEYWSDRLQVNARDYFETIKMIKSRIYSD